MRVSTLISAARATAATRLAVVLATFVLASCGGDGGNATGSTGPNDPKTGALSVTIGGLPGGAAAPGITLTNSAGFSRAVSGTETIASLAPGAYDLNAADVTVGTDLFGATPPTQAVTITAGGTASAAITYVIRTGSLTLSASGLPAGSVANVDVTGPNGYHRTVTAGTTLAGLAPGAYHLAASPVVVENRTYAPAAATVDVAVSASTNAVPAALAYQLASGSLLVVATGLPSGTPAQAIVTGPGDFRKLVAIGDLLENLTPGSYTVTAAAVTVGVDGYRVNAPLAIDVSPSITPVNASLAYTVATGRLAITVNGLPLGASAAITVTGPNGYAHPVTATQTLVGLAPGDYTIAAASVTTGALTYGGTPPSQVLSVPAGTTAAEGTVDYAVTTGSLTVSVNGLPQAVSGNVTVTGPGAYVAQVTTTTTLTNLPPGSYTVTAANATTGTHTYTPTPASRTVTVVAGSSAATASVTYALSTGGIAITVNGLQQNVLADMTVSGPNGYSQAVTGNQLLLGLPAGTYTLTARTVTSGPAMWAPNPTSQSIVVPPSTQAVAATVSYVTAIGSLAVTVNGLPLGVSAAVTVTGAGSYSRNVTSTTTITGLVQGTYTVTAATVSNAGTTYTPTPASANISVGGGVTSSATVTYNASGGPPPPPPPTLNFTIDGMHVQQVVQTYAGAVPLVAGRDGLLRVFVKANSSNTATPTVRVRLYNGATLTNTITINAPGSSVPQSVTEGTLNSSWNYTIPAALMQPGLKILADVDPTNAIAESSESDNAFPVSGAAAVMDVRTPSTFNLRLVPVLQSANGLQGGVTAGNAAQYTAETRAIYPITTVDADVRAPFTTNAPVLQSNDGNGAWGQILSEVNALRTADGSSRYYYGVVKVSYGSGIAGLGYVPGRAAIGWDYLPSASGVMSHELGHNFGRFHSPGCGAGGPDPSYPDVSGKLDAYGYDIAANALKSPSTYYDLMGYCDPTWISAYTYTGVLTYRTANPFMALPASIAGGYARGGLLVWGRIQNGQVILEPTFDVDAPPSLPTRGGRHRLQGFGALGQPLFDFSFDGEEVADHPGGTLEHFAFVVPYAMMRGQLPTRVRVAAAGRQAEYLSTAASPAAAAAPVVQRVNARAVRVQWNNSEARGVLIRHPRTGEILSFARGGDAIVYTSEGSLDLTLSDGVRSLRQRVTVGTPGASPQR